MEYLEFEKEIEELELQITNTKEIGLKTNSDVSKVITVLEKKILRKRKKFIKIYHLGKGSRFLDTQIDPILLII